MRKKLLHITILLVLALSTLALVAVQLPTTHSLKAANTLSTINVGGDLRGAAIDFAINRMFVAQYDTNKVVLIDLNTNAVYTTFNAGTNPWDVAANYLTQRVYVSNYGSDNLTVFQTSFDSPPGAVIATIPLGAGAKPIGVTVNPTTNKIYVANSGNNTVTIINGANNTVIKTLGVGTTPTH